MVRSVRDLPAGKFRGIIQEGPDVIYGILALILTAFGSVMLFSAGSGAEDPFAYLWSHGMHLLVGISFCVFLTLVINPKNTHLAGVVMYVAAFLLLILVLFAGKTVNQARRWLEIASFTFQPSELAKTALIVVLAAYFSVEPERYKVHWKQLLEYKKKYKSKPHPFRTYSKDFWKSFGKAFWFGVFIPGLLMAGPVVLTAKEPHFSGAIILAGVGGIMMLLGGTDLLQVICVGAPCGWGAWELLRSIPYTNARIEGLLNRGGNGEADEQTTRGLWAMGSGGWFGCGIGGSSMKYGFVAEPQNDFIFSIVCEELGFLGALLIILLFLALFSRGIRLARKSDDRFVSLVIAGISFKTVLHAFLNMGVAIAILPNTGISLPFFSSGGSAAIVQGIDVGLVLGLSRFCHTDSD